jgi:hypothetical protein
MSYNREPEFKTSVIESENGNAYNSYLRTLKYCNSTDVDEALKILSESLDINEISFNKLCLGEFYYSKYKEKAISVSKKLIKKATEIINSNKINNDDKELLIFWKENLKNLIVDFYEGSKLNIKEKTLKNPYPEVFSNYFSYKLFDRLHSHYKSEKNQLANYSFIYRKMVEDDYIKKIQKPEVFRVWLSEKPYEISIDPIKQMSNISRRHRDVNYENVIQLTRIELEKL